MWERVKQFNSFVTMFSTLFKKFLTRILARLVPNCFIWVIVKQISIYHNVSRSLLLQIMLRCLHVAWKVKYWCFGESGSCSQWKISLTETIQQDNVFLEMKYHPSSCRRLYVCSQRILFYTQLFLIIIICYKYLNFRTDWHIKQFDSSQLWNILGKIL